jgi:fructose-1,6-bisphosphatase/inositol monophosphatase family enzyme
MLELVAEVWPVQSVRVMGSAALGLAYAACGRYDLFMHHFLYPWDVAAGIVLVKEGGGAVLDRDGGAVGIDSEGVIAGAPAAVEGMLSLARDRPWRG